MNVFCCGISTVVDKSPKEVRDFGVFGDDTIVHNEVFDDVCEAYTQMGFRVNLEKSFGPGSSFRESCGVETWDGAIDVTPVRLSRDVRSTIDSLGAIHPVPAIPTQTVACESLVDLAVRCFLQDHNPILTSYLYDNLRRRGARFSNEFSVRWDEDRCIEIHAVLYSPTAERAYATSFGRLPRCNYYSPRDTRRWNGHCVHVPHDTETALQWALLSPQKPLSPELPWIQITQYPWLFNGSPLKD
jgi:hypothetical protein